VSSRLYDVTVGAQISGKEKQYALSGGPLPRNVENLVANLKAKRGLSQWTKYMPADLRRPPVEYKKKSNYYGQQEWQAKAAQSLKRHFGGESIRSAPCFVAGPIVSSDNLQKDDVPVARVMEVIRHCYAWDMESAGVYRASRGKNGDLPFIAIRGISDIVGFKRHPAWTSYACESAAAFTYAFLTTCDLPRPVNALEQ
jgi:nucleoside phosphorylase